MTAAPAEIETEMENIDHEDVEQKKTRRKKEKKEKKLKKKEKRKESKSDSKSDRKSDESADNDTTIDDTVAVDEQVADTNVNKNAEIDTNDKFDQQPKDGQQIDDDDTCKVFISRIPQCFTEERLHEVFVKHILAAHGENTIDKDNVLTNVSILAEKDADDQTFQKEDPDVDKPWKKEETKHRGCGFLILASIPLRNTAVTLGAITDTATSNSKRKYTMLIRPVVRSDDAKNDRVSDAQSDVNVCYLFARTGKCPYGPSCKFNHPSSLGFDPNNVQCTVASKKKRKCLTFYAKGKCPKGDNCPYEHISKKATAETSGQKDSKTKDPSEKDCINWKSKGKCRKLATCPYRHDPKLQELALSKRKRKNDASAPKSRTQEKKDKLATKESQPLSIRIFGLAYDTTPTELRKFLHDCGPIVELTFPTFEDSGRSKGFAGVLFQSPKAVEKAVELDGKELRERWLSIQPGKMYLKQWEKNLLVQQDGDEETIKAEVPAGEFGQKVKRRKKHGF